MAKEHAIDTFSMFKWLFHELKEVKLNQRALGRKMEAILVGNIQGNWKEVGQWSEEEKKSMLECIQRAREGIEQMKKGFENRISKVEVGYEKI